MRTPAEMVREAAEAEAMAKTGRDATERDWLLAKAAELRRLASRAEQVAKREGVSVSPSDAANKPPK